MHVFIRQWRFVQLTAPLPVACRPSFRRKGSCGSHCTDWSHLPFVTTGTASGSKNSQAVHPAICKTWSSRAFLEGPFPHSVAVSVQSSGVRDAGKHPAHVAVTRRSWHMQAGLVVSKPEGGKSSPELRATRERTTRALGQDRIGSGFRRGEVGVTVALWAAVWRSQWLPLSM